MTLTGAIFFITGDYTPTFYGFFTIVGYSIRRFMPAKIKGRQTHIRNIWSGILHIIKLYLLNVDKITRLKFKR